MLMVEVWELDGDANGDAFEVLCVPLNVFPLKSTFIFFFTRFLIFSFISVSGSSSQKSNPPSLGNLANASGADVLKWFDSDSLRTQLPNMPLPPQGQKVFTVDELERNQQAV